MGLGSREIRKWVGSQGIVPHVLAGGLALCDMLTQNIPTTTTENGEL